MGKNEKKRGGRSQSQRMKRQMAKTDKPINSNRADDHMGKREKLRRDAALENLRHINKYREMLGLPKLASHDEGLKPSDEADLGEMVVEDEQDMELVDADLIVCIRLFDTDTDGRPVGRKTDENSFCARHREIRRTRNRYRDIGGALLEVGKVFGVRKEQARKRKEKPRKATAVLKSIMVRLMPHEAELAASLKESDIAKAVDAVALAYQEQTGCEIVSAAVHRMVDTDLHIHLQYTMILGREEKDGELARRVAAWKRDLTAKARELLLKEDQPDPAPARIGKVKNQLLEDGAVQPKPEKSIVYQRVAGKRSMKDDSILGYSFRNKLNLVRAAEAGGDPELARKVAKKNDENRGLFFPISRMADEELNQRYRDLWLERVWRSQVVSMLPKTKYSKLNELGLQAAKHYEAYGTTRVEETHLVDKISELDKRAKEIEEQSSKLEKLKAEVSQRETTIEDDKSVIETGKIDLVAARKKFDEDKAAFEREREEFEKLRKSMELELAELRAQAITDAELRAELNGKLAELEIKVDRLRKETSQANKAEDIAVENLAKAKGISDHQIKTLTNACVDLKADRDALKNKAVDSERELSEEKLAKKQVEKDAKAERRAHERELKSLRVKNDTLSNAKGGLEKKVSGFKEIERLLGKLLEGITKLLELFVSNAAANKAVESVPPLKEALDYLCQQAFNTSFKEMVKKLSKTVSSLNILGEPDAGSPDGRTEISNELEIPKNGKTSKDEKPSKGIDMDD